MQKHKSCCNLGNCSSDNTCCKVFTNASIVSIINNIDKEINLYSKSRIANFLYGYKSKDNVEEFIVRLTSYKKVLESFRISLLHDQIPCLCSCKIDKLVSKISKLIGKDCSTECRKDVTVEENLGWILYNPYCVARGKWEKAAYQVCGELHMDVEITRQEDICDITFELISNNISCNIISAISVYAKVCDLTANVDIKTDSCNLTFDFQKTEEVCKINYKKLVTDTSCDLSYKKYLSLLDCKLNHSIIADVYGNKLRLDIIDDKPHLITSQRSYNLCDLKFTEVSSNACELLNFKPEVKEYLNSYNL
jgi:hypothetical protein